MRVRLRRFLGPVVLLAGLLALTGCFDVLEQFTFNPDGSGAYRMEASFPSALAGFMGDELRDWPEEMRSTGDTLPGVRLDTAYAAEETGSVRLVSTFQFDGVASLNRLLSALHEQTDELGQGGQSDLPTPRFTPNGRQIRAVARPASFVNQMGSPEFSFSNRAFEYEAVILFPSGTRIDTTSTSVSRDQDGRPTWRLEVSSDDAPVAPSDSSFVVASLPAAGLPTLYLVGGAAVTALIFTLGWWFVRRRAD